MKNLLALFAVLLLSTAAIAADKDKGEAKVKPCPKGQVATTSKVTGAQFCFAPTPFIATPVQPAKGGPVTAPVLKTN